MLEIFGQPLFFHGYLAEYTYQMLSVNNFYWLLYENLLKHCMLDAWYYYPFGTRQKCSRREFVDINSVQARFWEPKQRHHVFFHFDQEPLWNKDFGWHYDLDYRNTDISLKTVRILANSERSEIKTSVCRERHMLDWYYFYHGFAALDWFRDSQYIDNNKDFTKVFSSFNHLVNHKRSYRMALTARLIAQGSHKFGDISFYASKQECLDACDNANSSLSFRDKKMVRTMLESERLPMYLDSDCINGDFSAHFGVGEYNLWKKSFLHLVNETVFYDHKLHLTEKVFKPIVVQRPFILVSSPGNLAYLRDYGFQTFGSWIDESYDQIFDPSDRLDHIAYEIDRFCTMPKSRLDRIYREMKPVLEHNKQWFFGEFRRIIVDELIENFDGCLRIWNNGRVDGREQPRHPDLESVKRLFLT